MSHDDQHHASPQDDAAESLALVRGSALRPIDTSIRSKSPMAWQCLDCGGTGTITARFPIAPDLLAEQVWAKHHEHEKKRHCMCSGHYLQFWPLPNGKGEPTPPLAPESNR